MLDSLKSAILAHSHTPESELEKLSAVVKPMVLKARENFLRAGEVPDRFAFVKRGLLRYYYLDESGNEFTKNFFQEGFFLTSYSAMIQNRPSHFTIEALEESSIVVIYYKDWIRLYHGHACWAYFLVAMLERAFSIKETREREFLLLDAEARYRSFLESYPGLESRIKQHMIASYLGITPVALSRIRKKMSLVNLC